VLRAQRKPAAGMPQPARSLACGAKSSYRRRINWEREFFMIALRILPAFLIAAVFCLATPGAWAQTAPSGASTATTSSTETSAEKKKDEKTAKAQEEQEKKSKEEAAKEAKEGKTAPAAGSTSTTPETKTATNATESKTASASKTASGKSAGFASEAEAKASCPMDTVVWENTSSKVYHAANSKYYGKTKHGAYACSKAADAAGFKSAKN
jgi:cytoskeletal protein RodZ